MASCQNDSIDQLEQLMLLELFSSSKYQYMPLQNQSTIRLFRLEAGVGETSSEDQSLIHT
jgi:hypothetical protein